MIWATKLKSLKAINALLNEGKEIRVNDTDISGSTVLHHAAHFGIPEVVNVLLEHGADVFIKDCDGLSAYDVVCEGTSPGHVSVAALIYQKYSVECTSPTPLSSVQNTPTVSPGKFTRINSYLTLETALNKHGSPLQPHPLLRSVSKDSYAGSRSTSIPRPSTVTNIAPFSPIPEDSKRTLHKSASTPINSLSRSSTKLKRPVSAFGMSVDRGATTLSKSTIGLGSDMATVVLNPPDYHFPFVPINARISQSVHNMTGDGGTSTKPMSKSSLTILLAVEQCHNCENHAWCVWHDEEKYLSNAEEAILMCVCTFLNIPKLPLTVYGYRNKASKTRLGALEVSCSIFVPDEMNMGKFDPDNEEIHNIFASTRDKTNRGTWLHHILHSKLKTKSWPNITTIQENLLAIVEYIFSINNRNMLKASSSDGGTKSFILSPVKTGSKRSLVTTPRGSSSDVTEGYDHQHMGRCIYRQLYFIYIYLCSIHMSIISYCYIYIYIEEQYEQWWKRSVKTVEFASTFKIDTARSKISSRPSENGGSYDDGDDQPDVDGSSSFVETSSRKSDTVTGIENLPQTTGGTASVLMQMAADMERVKVTKKMKKALIIPPCFIESITKSSELNPNPVKSTTNPFPFQLTMKRKKELLIEYELKVLDHFFVFDNSTPIPIQK